MKNDIFMLFANCIPVKGARRSLLCDLQSGRMKLIPNSLYEILTDHKNRPLPTIKAAYDHAYDEQIDEYFAFLADHDWGIWCEDPGEFPDLDLTFETPEQINNAIIDLGADSQHDFSAIVSQLEDLGCRALQIRFFVPFPYQALCDLLEGTALSKLRSIEILIPFDASVEEEQWLNLCRGYPRICRLVVHSAPENRTVHAVDHVDDMGLLIFHTDVVSSHECCGIIDRVYFTSALETYTEALKHNNCLNKKISVDAKGHIRNCPSMARDYGHIDQVSLKEALGSESFKDPWHIAKDQIQICRDCEFRYVCTDCRAFVREPGNAYAHPAKCSYDPYTATWGKQTSSVFAV